MGECKIDGSDGCEVLRLYREDSRERTTGSSMIAVTIAWLIAFAR